MVLNQKIILRLTGNSGTFGRLILSSLVKNETSVKLIGDKVYQKEIFQSY